MRFRISKIKNENWRNYEYAEYQMAEQNQIMVFQIEEKFPNFKISKIIKFPLLTNSKKNNQSSEIVEFQKLANS